VTDFLHFSSNIMLVAALAAVVCFAFSGMSVLRSLRKQRS
jgi:hypothetical protein